MSKVLLQRFLDAVPKEFVKWLLERQLPIYQQSIASAFNEQPWGQPEAVTLLPYIDAQSGRQTSARLPSRMG